MLENWIHASEAIAVLAAVGYGLFTLSDRKRQEAAKATDTESSAAERVTEAAIQLLEPMRLRIASLEQEVRKLRGQLEQYIKDEAAYQAELHEKDEKIASLKSELAEARAEHVRLNERLRHLEDVCKAAGINGEEART